MLKIRKLGVLKMACFLGLFSFFVGIILSILIWILAGFLSTLLMEIPGASINIMTIFDFTNLVVFAFVNGVVGFVLGLILTPIMNLVFKIIGGLDIIIEEPEESQLKNN